jgi:hypothetical protein
MLKLRWSYHDQIAGFLLGSEKIFTNLWLILTQNIRFTCPEIHIIMRPSTHSVCPPYDHIPIPMFPYTVFYRLLPFSPTSRVISCKRGGNNSETKGKGWVSKLQTHHLTIEDPVWLGQASLCFREILCKSWIFCGADFRTISRTLLVLSHLCRPSSWSVVINCIRELSSRSQSI